MRQHRLVALGTVLNLHGFNVVVAPPFALAGVRHASLRYGHRSSPCSEVLGMEKIKLDRTRAPVKGTIRAPVSRSLWFAVCYFTLLCKRRTTSPSGGTVQRSGVFSVSPYSAGSAGFFVRVPLSPL